MIINGYQEAHMATTGTTVVYAGPCTLRMVSVNKTAIGATTITDSDGVTSAGTVLVIKPSTVEKTFVFDAKMQYGITFAKATTAGDYTITYSIE
jgi:hypothetical protein